MQTITPFLWFDGNAEEAARFYVSIFANAKITSVTPMLVRFELDGQPLMALNGGPEYTFTAAASFYVSCETQSEVDTYWEKLSQGGEPGRCGWLKDRFGLSWQVIPAALGELMESGDDEQSQRVMEAMFRMSKLEIAGLKAAFDNA